MSSEGVAMKPDHVKTMAEWPLPKTGRELASLLGFVNYSRNHLKKPSGNHSPTVHKIDQKRVWEIDNDGGRGRVN